MENIGADKGMMRAVTLTLTCIILVYLMAPLFVVFPISVTDQRFLSFPYEEISFQHYHNVVHGEKWLSSIWESIAIAAVATVIDVVLGTMCAVGCWRLANKYSELVRMMMLAPIVIPSIVYTLGIYRFYVDLEMIDSFWGVVIAHAVTGFAYPVITVSANLAGFDLRLEQAARILGANLMQTNWRIIVPNIMPGILSGGIFAFIHSWDETVMVLFIAGRTVYTLPRRMWNDINENLDPSIAAVAVLLIGVTLALLFTEMLVKRRKARISG
jgi:putative spermidine/putrescine transport system permease protein